MTIIVDENKLTFVDEKKLTAWFSVLLVIVDEKKRSLLFFIDKIFVDEMRLHHFGLLASNMQGSMHTIWFNNYAMIMVTFCDYVIITS